MVNIKKKVLFLLTCMTVGGAEKVLIDLVNEMNDDKYDITVVFMYKHNIYKTEEQNFRSSFKSSIKVKYLCDNESNIKYRLFNIALNRINNKWLHRFFIGINYDVEIAFTEGLPTTFLANSSNMNSKKIAWFHTDAVNRKKYMSCETIEKEKKIYKKFDKVVAVSKTCAESFAKVYGEHHGLCVKYNDMNVNEIEKLSKEPVGNELEYIYKNRHSDECLQLILVTVGRIIEVKGYERLVEALRRLKEENYNFKLIMIGDGERKDSIKHQIKDLGLDNDVIILGFKDNPYKYMATADFFVCSSYAEGYSTSVIESLCLGVPIITTECSGMREIFADHNCGLICENSTEGIYNGLKEVFDDSSRQLYYKSEALTRKEELKCNTYVKDVENLIDGVSCNEKTN